MSSVITDVYKMKKRRSPSGETSKVVGADVTRPSSSSSLLPSSSQHRFISDGRVPSTSPRTPRRSPRINGAFSRTAINFENGRHPAGGHRHSHQQSPEAMEPLITWKCNSPVYSKSLQPISGRDLKEIVKKFVPSTKTLKRQPSSSSLLDLWWAPCEMPPLVTPAEIVHSRSKETGQAAKELQDLINKVNSDRSSESNDGFRGENSKTTIAYGRIQQSVDVSDVWEDDDLFDNEDFMAATQQVEQVAKRWHLDAQPTLRTKDNQLVDVNNEELEGTSRPPETNGARENSTERQGCEFGLPASPDILDWDTQCDDILERATQVDERSRSPDMTNLMDMGFVWEEDAEENQQLNEASNVDIEHSRPFRDIGREVRSAVVEVDRNTEGTLPASQIVCSQEQILQKKEDALSRRSQRLISMQPRNILEMPSTSSTSFRLAETDDEESSSIFNNELEKIMDAIEISRQPKVSSQSVASQAFGSNQLTQMCTQDAIQRKKAEALKRRSARLAAQATTSRPAATQPQQQLQHCAMTSTQRQLCSLQEIERKKSEAIEKRKKRLMAMMHQQQQHQQQSQNTSNPRYGRLVAL